MTDTYSRIFAFFDELALNNNRPWFAAHRPEFDELRAAWMADLGRLINAMTTWMPALEGQTPASCSYRIYRDTRFSPDKTPLKTYFSAAISPFGRKTHYAGFYIQVGLDEKSTGLYGGVWCPEAPLLAKLRHAIVDNTEEFTDIITTPAVERDFPGWVGDRLKTIPKGWERNHPQAELLRLKEYGKFHNCSRAFFADPEWPDKASQLFHELLPLIDFLNYSIDE